MRRSEHTCVDHRLRYRSDGSLMRSWAQALVTCVNARLRHSRLPNDPELSSLERSASVDFDGSVSFRGPPFCCWIRKIESYMITLPSQMIKSIDTHSFLLNKNNKKAKIYDATPFQCPTCIKRTQIPKVRA